MFWIFEFGTLLVVAFVLRRVLHFGPEPATEESSPRFRRPRNSPLCSPLAAEIEGHTSILAVLLNDVIEEQNAGNTEVARRMLSVFNSERERLVELVISLQNLSLKYLPTIQYPIEARFLNHEAFRSQPVSDLIKRHQGLEQFIFRAKLRFQLQLRLMRRGTALLNESFEELRYDPGTNAGPFVLEQVLSQLDLYFHDLDLLAKETLLGFNAELAGLPDAVLEEVAAELSALTSQRSVLHPLTSSVQR